MKQPRDVAAKRSMKRYLTPSTILATTALFFAPGGAAYATNRYVITSTSQLKPSVIKALHGDQGASGSTGVTGANGSNGKGEAPAMKTPSIAALQATANQRVSGIMIASQVARRWLGVRPVLSRPSHKPTAISPWAINWCAEVGTPLAGINGCR